MENIDFIFNTGYYRSLKKILLYRFEHHSKDIFSVDELNDVGGAYTYFAIDFLFRHGLAEPCINNPAFVRIESHYSMQGLLLAARAAHRRGFKNDVLLNLGILGFFLSVLSLLIQFEPFVSFLKGFFGN